MSLFRLYLSVAVAAMAFAVYFALHPPPVPVLLLHDVKPDRPGWDFWTLHPDRFREIVALLDRTGYRGISLDEAARHVAGQLPLARAREAVLITVDDGCPSSATLVAPELARHGHAATFFVVAGWGAPDHLSPDQIRGLWTGGHDVGSHSMTHAGLNVQPRADARAEAARIAGELARSRTRLTELAPRPVDSFAYPKGEWDATTKRLAREAGYRLAFTTDLGYLEPGADPYELPRFQLNFDTPLSWIEDYLTAPRRERTRNLSLVVAIAVLALAAAVVARPGKPREKP